MILTTCKKTISTISGIRQEVTTITATVSIMLFSCCVLNALRYRGEPILHRVSDSLQEAFILLRVLLDAFFEFLSRLLRCRIRSGDGFIEGLVDVVREPNTRWHHQRQRQTERRELRAQSLKVHFCQSASSQENGYGKKHACHRYQYPERQEPKGRQKELLEVDHRKDNHEIRSEIGKLVSNCGASIIGEQWQPKLPW